ncbi:MAG: hypothetical protein AAB250_02120, partial [Bdellovibrionota bacterium]
IMLIGGFGLLARLGMVRGLPAWAIAKIGIWIVIGALPAFIYRKPQFARLFWALIVVLGTTAAWLAILKPF